jgi:hypothetical protein
LFDLVTDKLALAALLVHIAALTGEVIFATLTSQFLRIKGHRLDSQIVYRRCFYHSFGRGFGLVIFGLILQV